LKRPFPQNLRLWVATLVVIIVVVAVWKFVDYRMRPPVPPPLPKEEGVAPKVEK
jgi:hypothetical protein